MPRYMVKRSKEMSFVIDADDGADAEDGARAHDDEHWQLDEDMTLEVSEVDSATPLTQPE